VVVGSSGNNKSDPMGNRCRKRKRPDEPVLPFALLARAGLDRRSDRTLPRGSGSTASRYGGRSWWGQAETTNRTRWETVAEKEKGRTSLCRVPESAPDLRRRCLQVFGFLPRSIDTFLRAPLFDASRTRSGCRQTRVTLLEVSPRLTRFPLGSAGTRP
jgi:hypothetical protein